MLRMLAVHPERWGIGAFVLLYRAENRPCSEVADAYGACLTYGESFETLRIEELLAAMRHLVDQPWVADLNDR